MVVQDLRAGLLCELVLLPERLVTHSQRFKARFAPFNGFTAGSRQPSPSSSLLADSVAFAQDKLVGVKAKVSRLCFDCTSGRAASAGLQHALLARIVSQGS